jgi:hypothetical protein
MCVIRPSVFLVANLIILTISGTSKNYWAPIYGIFSIFLLLSIRFKHSSQHTILTHALSYLWLRYQLSQTYKQSTKLHVGSFSPVGVLFSKTEETLLLTVRYYWYNGILRLTYDIMGRFHAAATNASERQVSSGPIKATVPLSLISVMTRIARVARDDWRLWCVPISAARYCKRLPGNITTKHTCYKICSQNTNFDSNHLKPTCND